MTADVSTSQIPVAFRLEASKQYGLGHLLRCINVAKGLPLPIRPIFITKGQSDTEIIRPFLTGIPWETEHLDPSLTPEADAHQTTIIREKYGAQLLVTDLCHFETVTEPERLWSYHRELKRLGTPFIMSLEDPRMGEYNSHLAVLPYLDDEKSIDDFCARDECQLAFGVKYFTANPRIVNAGRIARAYEAHGKNILVSISGTDPKAVTPRVLAAIQAMKAPELNVRILLSDAAAPELLAAVTATCQSNAQLEYCGFNESLADHLLWADLAILGEGHIKYDAAIVGTPCLIISQYDHDSSLVRSFYNLNCSIYLGAEGALDQKRLQVSIQSTLENLTLRQAMGAAGKTAIDGRGISRLYENHLRQILL